MHYFGNLQIANYQLFIQMLKAGKEEIIYLLTKVIEKYKAQTGLDIIQNTNRKNYEVIAIALSNISNELPTKWQEYGTEIYTAELNSKSKDFPYRKYDITGGQIKDALNGMVASPRSFLVDACYIYLFGMGRKAFEENPTDTNLLQTIANNNTTLVTENLSQSIAFAQLEKLHLQSSKRNLLLATIATALAISLIALFIYFIKIKNDWAVVKNDFNYLPYQPTQAEIDSLEGIWLVYTGSPQARVSNPDRYHKVVSNIVDVKYKNGYFTYDRYGASFDHLGYMQFQSEGIVAIYSKINNKTGKTESPRYSLLNLYPSTKYLTAISASWNFDIGEKNQIIGIREIYIKVGKGGKVEEVINDIENASCQCKLIRWHQQNNQVKTFYLKNELLDSLTIPEIKPLINENSILLNTPQNGLIISKDSGK